jgi:hypothetical protein
VGPAACWETARRRSNFPLSAGELSVAANANLVIVGADPADPSETVIDGNKQSRVLALTKAGSLKATLTVTQSDHSTPILTRGVKFTAKGPAKARGATAIWTALGARASRSEAAQGPDTASP